MANVYDQDQKKPCPTVWAFVRQFRGLSGTAKAKAICEAAAATEDVANIKLTDTQKPAKGIMAPDTPNPDWHFDWEAHSHG
jgi:hypothetical protein